MPLTPEDVRNKQFTTVRLREGYDEDEVDAFLDEVESELTRLLRENEDLRAKLAAATRCSRGATRCSSRADRTATAPRACSRSPSRPPTRRLRKPVPRRTRSSARRAAGPRDLSGTRGPRRMRWSGMRRRSTAWQWA